MKRTFDKEIGCAKLTRTIRDLRIVCRYSGNSGDDAGWKVTHKGGKIDFGPMPFNPFAIEKEDGSVVNAHPTIHDIEDFTDDQFERVANEGRLDGIDDTVACAMRLEMIDTLARHFAPDEEFPSVYYLDREGVQKGLDAVHRKYPDKKFPEIDDIEELRGKDMIKGYHLVALTTPEGSSDHYMPDLMTALAGFEP